MLRKLLEIPENETANQNWKKIPKENREEIKKISMAMLINESEKKLKFQFCNIVSQIFENVSELQEEDINSNKVDDLEEFPEVFEFISKFLFGELNEAYLLNIESSLQLLSANYPDLDEEFQENKAKFIQSFRNFFQTTSLSLKTKVCRTIAEIISYSDKNEIKPFMEFILSILENTLRCFENPNEEANVSDFAFHI